MACNSCSKPFSLLRPEKGCPGCGFSYCSKCLKEKVFVLKINSEAKVCAKCKCLGDSNKPKITKPPDAYYKRIGALDDNIKSNNNMNVSNSDTLNTTDQQILDRLIKLKQENQQNQVPTNIIESRLQKLKGDTPSTSDAELQLRLANVKGVPMSSLNSKPLFTYPEHKSDQEQVDEIMKQFVEQTKLDTKYNEEFDGVIRDIETRLQNLKSSSSAGTKLDTEQKFEIKSMSESQEMEEKEINKIIGKAKKEIVLEDNETVDDVHVEELPFCEICNEDAKMRCLGCKYLFCKRCFMEHKDDDDGCNRYEMYSHTKRC